MIKKHADRAKMLIPTGLLIHFVSAPFISQPPDRFFVSLALLCVFLFGLFILGLGLSRLALAKGLPSWYGIFALLSWVGLLVIIAFKDKTVHEIALVCQQCGYRLDGLSPNAPCPECGYVQVSNGA